MKQNPRPLAALAAVAAFALPGMPLAQAQVTPQTLQSISMPNKVVTPIGQLEFFDGVPTDATIDKLYDNLDRMRGIEVYLNNQGAASMNAMRAGNASIGANASNKVPISAQLLKPESLYLTGNTSTLYAVNYLDLKTDGPLVVELPPGMLGFLDDAWFRFVSNLGVIGPDKGKGGKYLLLPPGYKGTEPEGYFIVRPPTYNNLMFLRGSIAHGLAPAVENIKSKLKIYPLAKADNPAPTEFIDFSGKRYSTIVSRDLSSEILSGKTQ